MIPDIEAVFLDLGDTLRMLVKDEAHMRQAREAIVHLLGCEEDPDAFYEKLEARYKQYRDWAFDTLQEAPEAELWTRWMAPEFPRQRVANAAIDLSFQFRQSKGRRVVVEGGREVIAELQRRGYVLGVISNLITSREIPDWMEAEGFTSYFKSVVLSSTYGRRKPDPAIYLEAARRIEVQPAHCAYVGDNLKRDVVGARSAGFGMVVIMISPQKLAEESITDQNRPDVLIKEFRELLDVFPEKQVVTG